jgi:hypothetical protein
VTTAKIEIFLARLYADEDFLARFLRDVPGVLAGEKLTEPQRKELAEIDRSQLILAARSYRSKRGKKR